MMGGKTLTFYGIKWKRGRARERKRTKMSISVIETKKKRQIKEKRNGSLVRTGANEFTPVQIISTASNNSDKIFQKWEISLTFYWDTFVDN